ncbi:hypothetical protein BDW22DRAFT_37932 [Trametopsis cervina]|nr:hypothetical protein BDW22DRAFT_37932 [Trametopsis cervina]
MVLESNRAQYEGVQFSPSSWTSRELDLDLGVMQQEHLYTAVAIALRVHSPSGPLMFDSMRGTMDRQRMSVPLVENLGVFRSLSQVQDLSGDAALLLVEDPTGSVAELASSFNITAAICASKEDGRLKLRISFSTQSMGLTAASWLIIHIARALRYMQLYRSFPPPSQLATLGVFSYLADDPFDPSEDITTPGTSPSAQLLHGCFAHWAQLDPLGKALVCYETHDHNGPQRSYTYGALFSAALILAQKLAALPGEFVGVPINTADWAEFALSLIAVSLCGKAYSSTARHSKAASKHDMDASALLAKDCPSLLRESGQLLSDVANRSRTEDATSLAALSTPGSICAYWPQSAPLDQQETWISASHLQLTTMLKRRHRKFTTFPHASVLFFGCGFDQRTAIFMWEAFFHCALVQTIDSTDMAVLPVTVFRDLRTTHLVTDSDNLILSLCNNFVPSLSGRVLSTVLVKSKGSIEPLTRFSGIKMIAYDEDWNEPEIAR